MGRFLYYQSWSNRVTYILTVDTKGIPQLKHGTQDHLARTLFERPDGAAPTTQQRMTVEDPDVQNIWIRKG
eukprot:12880380-Prorocentrum_lima.AAC.1